MRLKLLTIILVSSVFSCTSENACDNVDISSSTTTVNFTHLSQEILSIDSKEQTEAFFANRPLFAKHIMGRGSYPDSIFIKDQTNRFSNAEFKKLVKATIASFGDYTELESEISDALKRVDYYFPDYSIPSIITGVTGFADNTQLVDLDSAIFIGLDFFLGDKSPYQPQSFEYMKPFYRPEMIARSVVFAKVGPELLKTKQLTADESSPLPILNNNITMLDEMVTFGRLLYFTKKTLNCPHDSIVTGFTTQELAILRDNKNMLWEHFIKNELLYKTDHIVKVRYMEPRPFTNEISKECPGRLGQWFGYQIVKQYMEKNPDVSLSQLMEETDEQKIFSKSTFRP